MDEAALVTATAAAAAAAVKKVGPQPTDMVIVKLENPDHRRESCSGPHLTTGATSASVSMPVAPPLSDTSDQVSQMIVYEGRYIYNDVTNYKCP